MKKILLTLVAIIFATTLFAQTGTGWERVRKKQRFVDTTYFNIAPLYAPTAYETLSEVVPFLADTIPLVKFGLGSGLTADTAVFIDNALAGDFYNEGSDTLVITQLMGILAEGTGTETVSVQVSWHATFKSGSATKLNTNALAITSITTGTADVAFANSKIPPNVFVWCTISAVSAGNRPSYLSVTLSGFKIPKY